MKLEASLILILAAIACARGQGTFIYDQQSGDERAVGEGWAAIQLYQPTGQSFTPALSSVGFVRLAIVDAHPGNGLGAAIYVNLRTDGISGPVLGSTTAVLLPDGFGGGTNSFVDFFLSAPADVTPGTSYYFQPVVQSGEDFMWRTAPFPYAGGAAYFSGQPSTGDMWFREGIIPEPSSALLAIVCVGTFLCLRRRLGKA